MSKIPPALLKEILADPYYKECCRKEDGGCAGRITFEHSLIFASRQLQEKWAILPLCARHHEVDDYQDNGDLNKERNIQIALNRANTSELSAISKAIDYIALRDRLNKKYA